MITDIIAFIASHLIAFGYIILMLHDLRLAMRVKADFLELFFFMFLIFFILAIAVLFFLGQFLMRLSFGTGLLGLGVFGRGVGRGEVTEWFWGLRLVLVDVGADLVSNLLDDLELFLDICASS
jgi:hypothetical protein